jgi:hypothetical protein
MTDKKAVLLIHPPFSMPDKPCISIPALAAQMKRKGIHVRGLDANIEFWRRFLSPKNLQTARAHAEERWEALQGKVEMNDSEKAECTLLKNALNGSAAHWERLLLLFEPNLFSNVERFHLFWIALSLASTPYYPERLGATGPTGYIRYFSPHHKFASGDMLASLQHKTIYASYLEDILCPAIERHSPLLAGISLSFPDQALPAFKCAQIIKNRFPGVHVVIGGAFVSCHMRELSNIGVFDVVDSLVLDDGEIPLEALVEELSSPSPNFHNIPGLMYAANGVIAKNAPAVPLDMELLPAPDYSIFPLERYLVPINSMALLFRLSRGCYWARCTFCRTELPLIHCYSQAGAGRIFEHLKSVVEQTGVTIFHFTDDAASPETLEAVSRKIIQAGMQIKWVANFRFDRRLTLERLLIFKLAGCHTVYLGLESYNSRILKLMRKGIDIKQVKPILDSFARAGIRATIYMIVGFPTETEEEARNSFNHILSLKAEGLVHRVIYNVFELQSFSTIELNYKMFGIKKIGRNPKADLSPPTMDFDSTGMTREQAVALCSSFISALQSS